MRARILAVTVQRNEGVHLLEWIAHHRAAGIDDILIFSNDCTDGSDDLLDALDHAGIVTHLRNAVPEGRTPQWSALKQAAAHPLYARADWVAVLDSDEFVNLRAPLVTLRGLIGAAGGADAVVLPWRLFGSAGHAVPPEGLTLESYDRAIPETALYPALSRYFKTLYRRAGFAAPGVHRPRAGDAAVWVDGSGRRLPDTFSAAQGRIMLWGEPLATELVQLNHYSVRSAQDFLLKRQRGLPNHTDKAIDLTYWVERNFNAVRDRSIARMIPATRAELGRLLRIDGIAARDADLRAGRAARIAAALRDPDTVQVFGRLLLAGDSAVPTEATARSLIALYGEATR